MDPATDRPRTQGALTLHCLGSRNGDSLARLCSPRWDRKRPVPAGCRVCDPVSAARRTAAAAASGSESEKRRAAANGGGVRSRGHRAISLAPWLPRPARPPLSATLLRPVRPPTCALAS